jgi:hypothetical protein
MGRRMPIANGKVLWRKELWAREYLIEEYRPGR